MTFEITIPVLNEAATLERQVLLLREFLRNHPTWNGKWSILIADNGSTDETGEIARSLSSQFTEIQCLHVSEKGVGLALKTAWNQSAADIIGYMDLDFSTDLSHLTEAINAIERDRFDVVYGTRLHPQSVVKGRTLKREITSRVFNFMVKRYLDVSFSDGMCGFKFLRRTHFQQLQNAGAVSNGWFFSTELLTVAEWKGLKIKELPVKWTDDAANSKVRIFPLAMEYLSAMRRLKKRRI